MRKLIAWNVMTLDGYFEGPEPWSLDFHGLIFGPEVQERGDAQLRDAGLLLFGRKTFTGMASYWPTAEGEGDTARQMNSLPKAVISNTLERADWNNSTLFRGDGVEVVRGLKAEAGGTIYVFGSAELLASLLAHGLVDEYRLCIAPVLLGKGNPLFKTADARIGLELRDARAARMAGFCCRIR